MKQLIIISTLFLCLWQSKAQTGIDTILIYSDTKQYYEDAFLKIQSMLKGDTIDLKKAVFEVENAYYENKLNYKAYCSFIKKSISLINAFKDANNLKYIGNDYENVSGNAALYVYMMDTIWLMENKPLHLPFSYRFVGSAKGYDQWDDMFIIKLMETGKGNCYSLSFLYKILAEEMGIESYLALAPRHMYIKCKNEESGWYNIELSNGMFPIDAWISASGYVQTEAIRSGAYMDTLGLKQTLAVCLYSLAKGFQAKYGFAHYNFVIKCLDLSLEYYPNFISALLLKSETLIKRLNTYITIYKAKDYTEIQHLETPKALLAEIEQIASKILDLGYREMPEEMYKEWLYSMQNNMEKYQNRKIRFYLKK